MHVRGKMDEVNSRQKLWKLGVQTNVTILKNCDLVKIAIPIELYFMASHEDTHARCK